MKEGSKSYKSKNKKEKGTSLVLKRCLVKLHKYEKSIFDYSFDDFDRDILAGGF